MASGDGAARLWSVEGGHLAGPPLRQRDNMTAATFSPDGTKIVTCGWGEPARLWDRPLPFEGDVEKVLLWTEAATGLAMEADGVFRRLEAGAWRERRLRQAASAK
jgi:WD40 repeat protein